ncbi:hypothetical protein [Sporosarcina sp. HYO08]|uniref:hypothetical protein n=1 Tax=Sporosarcina sp. HYO08 TaxID=1759557 RepID=UPI00079322F6|nr:hypothetical protein [Sporosarcina sp. HYO08]KXH83811.1 hypothetical protein AU377_03345 [Sporosarcina sp. HYO08]
MNQNYPNKADHEPNTDKHLKNNAYEYELPLADPSESNETETFRQNESTTAGENEPSAFDANKDLGPHTELSSTSRILSASEKNELNLFVEESHHEWNEL